MQNGRHNIWVELWYVNKDKSNDSPNLEMWNLIVSVN